MIHSQTKNVVTFFIGVSLLVLSSSAIASIADSYHNLGSGNPFTTGPNGRAVNKSNNTGEICVFCHTPHGGAVTIAGQAVSVPIWNRELNSPTAYSTYGDLGTSTFDATQGSIGSVSIACLSCHDGQNALDSVLNKPGSGGYSLPAAGGGYDGLAGRRIGGLVGGDLDADGSLLEPTSSADMVQNLGLDLRNDHPVSMQYGGGGWVVGAGAINPKDADFRTPTLDTKSGQYYIDGGRLASILTGYTSVGSLKPGERDRLDIILYNRNTAGFAEPYVECGSCHDPHNTDNPTFLRLSNSPPSTAFPNAKGGPSALCLTCHNK
jgi:hypothetical protein